MPALPLVNIAPTKARDVPVRPLVKLQPIEGNALLADSNLRKVRSHLRVEAIAVHTQVRRGIP
jgi:hypothetical protein